MMERAKALAESFARSSFARFLLVGGASSVAYSGVDVLAVELASMEPVLAVAPAFVAGTLVSYLGNSRFTFKAKAGERKPIRFLCVTIAGFLLSLGIAALAEKANAHYLLGTLLTLILVPIFNYAGHALWTFRKTTPKIESETKER
jgi:putative flippase GtrA